MTGGGGLSGWNWCGGAHTHRVSSRSFQTVGGRTQSSSRGYSSPAAYENTLERDVSIWRIQLCNFPQLVDVHKHWRTHTRPAAHTHTHGQFPPCCSASVAACTAEIFSGRRQALMSLTQKRGGGGGLGVGSTHLSVSSLLIGLESLI